ncbi:MAG: hypothetical protein AABW88_03340 [Nanoarchaeota archaeon]
MNFLIEKLVLTLFILSLKTKKIVRSAVSGRLNYRARIYAPFLIGFLILAWAVFIMNV